MDWEPVNYLYKPAQNLTGHFGGVHVNIKVNTLWLLTICIFVHCPNLLGEGKACSLVIEHF